MTDKKVIVNLDFRTLLFLDVLIMLFMLLSGKAEVTLIAFVIAGTVLMVFGLYVTVIRCTIVFAVLFLYYFAITHSNGSVFQGSLLSVIGIIAFIIQRIIPFLMLAIAIKERKNISEITTALAELKSKGYTIIVIEHRLYYLADICDRLIVFEYGKMSRIYEGVTLKASSRDGCYGRTNVWLHKIFNRRICCDWRRISYSLWYCWRLCREAHFEKTFQKHGLIRIAARGGVHYENEKRDTIPRFSKAIQKSVYQLCCAGGDRCVFRTRPLLHCLSLVSQAFPCESSMTREATPITAWTRTSANDCKPN